MIAICIRHTWQTRLDVLSALFIRVHACSVAANFTLRGYWEPQIHDGSFLQAFFLMLQHFHFHAFAFHRFVVDCTVVYIGLRRHRYAQTAHAAEVRDAAAAHKAALQEVPHTFKSLRFVLVSPISENLWSSELVLLEQD